MNNKILKTIAMEHFKDADLSDHFSDVAKTVDNHITINYEWFYQNLYDAYMRGFHDGHRLASGKPKDEYGNFIE